MHIQLTSVHEVNQIQTVEHIKPNVNYTYLYVFTDDIFSSWFLQFSSVVFPCPSTKNREIPSFLNQHQIDVASTGLQVQYDSIWIFPKIMVPPKSSILIGFSIINHPFCGTPIFGNTHIYLLVITKLHGKIMVSFLEFTPCLTKFHGKGTRAGCNKPKEPSTFSSKAKEGITNECIGPDSTCPILQGFLKHSKKIPSKREVTNEFQPHPFFRIDEN